MTIIRAATARLPEVSASNSTDLASCMRDIGYAPQEVFVKYNSLMDMCVDTGLHSYMKADVHMTDWDRHFSEEFALLARLNRIAPEGVAKPIALIKSAGDVVGYASEHVDGVTLYRLSQSFSAGRSEILAALSETHRLLERIHENFAAHGDLNANNVIVTGFGKVVLVDPMPHRGWTDDENANFKAALRSDAHLIINLTNFVLMNRNIPLSEFLEFRRSGTGEFTLLEPTFESGP